MLQTLFFLELAAAQVLNLHKAMLDSLDLFIHSTVDCLKFLKHSRVVGFKVHICGLVLSNSVVKQLYFCGETSEEVFLAHLHLPTLGFEVADVANPVFFHLVVRACFAH